MRSARWLATSTVILSLVAACASAPPASPPVVRDSPAARTAAPASEAPTPVATVGIVPVGRILFARHNPVTDDVFCYRIQADGTGEMPWAWCGPTSPDGRRILSDHAQPNGFGAFVGGRPVTTAPDGTDFRMLDAYPRDDISFWCSGWSPDGSRILCESGADAITADDGIYTLRASDGGDRRRISTAPAGHEDQPQGYSPDGQRILFTRYQDGDAGELWSVATDGSDPIRLNPAPLAVSDWSTPASWSPDGSRVAFAAASTDGAPRSLYVVGADGRDVARISPADVGGVTAQWSPDGSWITFMSRTCCQPQVWVVRPDGTGALQLSDGTDGSTSYGPIWSPDGSEVLFYRDLDGHQTLWIAERDGSQRRQIADAGAGLDLGAYWWSAS